MLRSSSRVATRALASALSSASGPSGAGRGGAATTAAWREGVGHSPGSSSRGSNGGSSGGTGPSLPPTGAAGRRRHPYSAPLRHSHDARRGFADFSAGGRGAYSARADAAVDMGAGEASTSTAGAGGGKGDPAAAEVDRTKHYSVEVTTSSVRGAGTSGHARLTFIGGDGATSPPMPLEYEVGSSPGFVRGTTLPFRVSTPASLGALSQVQVELIPEMSQVGHGWLLENVTVQCEETGASWHFHSHKWFGQSDGGGEDGPLQQVLSPRPLARDPEAAAALIRNVEERPRINLDVSAGAATVPHPEKTNKEGMRAVMQREWGYGGEDAYFVKKITKRLAGLGAGPEHGDGAAAAAEEIEDTHLAFGVADGVYLWRWEGIDAGLYSRRLMGLASEAFADNEGKTKTLENRWDSWAAETDRPEQLLGAAFDGVSAEKIKGSTTACVAVVDAAHGVLRTANIGDSGFMLVRGDSGRREVRHRSQQQEHEFGRPFQLGHHEHSDHPSDAMLTTFPLEPGDIIVMGSDGLWDNLSEAEILEVIEKVFSTGGSAHGGAAESPTLMNRASREIVSAAYHASMDKKRTTPYSLAATEWFDMVYSGGKRDDITAVVVNVGGPERSRAV